MERSEEVMKKKEVLKKEKKPEMVPKLKTDDALKISKASMKKTKSKSKSEIAPKEAIQEKGSGIFDCTSDVTKGAMKEKGYDVEEKAVADW